MITINLLPDHLRRPDPTPLPLAMAFLAGLVITGFLGVLLYRYHAGVIPRLEKAVKSQKTRKAELEREDAELQVMRQRMAGIREHVDAVRTLYKGRTVWARILSDIKYLVTQDAMMDSANAEHRYLWLNSIKFQGTRLTLQGNATAASPALAMQMAERLLYGLRTYAPTKNPEEVEIQRIEAELAALRTERAAESADFVPLDEREAELRRRLAEIRGVHSGGIAQMPFMEFIKPGSIAQHRMEWVALARPKPPPMGSPDTVLFEQIMATFPEMALRFGLDMELAPPPGSEE